MVQSNTRTAASADIGLVETVARLIGTEAAARVERALGGTSVYVSKFPRPKSRLVQLLGKKGAERIGQELGGAHCYVPRINNHVNDRRAQVRMLSLAGLPVSEIALATGMSERHTSQVRRELREAGDLPAPSPKKPSKGTTHAD